ncbi:MAG: NTP transferase domain-containing protein [Gemmatimonadetes bacterium]|nr:NTP transferase domain-containing protein [Gemmatimonadota bacterium]
MSRWVVVLAGGVGSRFWPLSTPARPKQLLPLITDTPLLSETLQRLEPLADADHTLILTNASLVEAIRDLLPGVPSGNVIAEPRPAGTAAALAWAAHVIAGRDPEGTMLSVHADWAVGDPVGFRSALTAAAVAAEQHHALVTVGVLPVRPDPGFGYIQPGEPVTGPLRRVRRFAEKPSRERAAEMIREGYLWNSGIFVWRAQDFLAEVEALTPEVAPALAAHRNDIAAFFGAVTSIAVDVGVLERSQRVMVLPGDFGWDDIGTWEALARVRHLDDHGNAAQGSVFPVDSSRNVVHAEEGDVVLYGVSDLVVVTCRGMTLVTTTARAADLKLLIDQLPANVRQRE